MNTSKGKDVIVEVTRSTTYLRCTKSGCGNTDNLCFITTRNPTNHVVGLIVVCEDHLKEFEDTNMITLPKSEFDKLEMKGE